MMKFRELFHLDELIKTEDPEIQSEGDIIELMKAAIWCLLRTETYKECVLKAVNLGGKTDTLGAITGSLAGLYYGYEKIPKEWISVIVRKEWILSLCEQTK